MALRATKRSGNGDDSRNWRWIGRPRGGTHGGPAGLPGGSLRNARNDRWAPTSHSGTPDHRVWRTGLFELLEERIAEYGSMAAETGDAARGFRPVADRR